MWLGNLVCGLFAFIVVSSAVNVVLNPSLFAVNVVSQLPCLRFEALLFAVRYSYKRTVVSLAVLGDERRNWKPNEFGYELWGCEVNFKFPIVKLLDYFQQWSALEASSNPFATVVMAHLKAQETRDNRSSRFEWKLALTRRLYERGYEREDVINLFGFIDWVMSLPEELEQEFWREVRDFEEEQLMPYITSVERIGIQKGIEQSQQQMRQVLLESLELGLELKFGSQGLRLLPEISLLEDVEQLRAIQALLKTATTLDELRQIIQRSD